ncbi:MAG: hypothetical protein ACXADB_14165 [Candidatus Hermodarchaeia archaeon]|jgi:hypothetical protein
MLKDNNDLLDDLDDFEFEVDEDEDGSAEDADGETPDPKNDSEETDEDEDSKAEDSDEEENSDEEGSSVNKTYDELTEDEQKQMGKRAQKRIGKLVAERNAANQRLQEFAQHAQELERKATEAEETALAARHFALEQANNRLDAFEEVAKTRARQAREDGDIDLEQEALSALNTIAVEKGQLTQAKLALGEPPKRDSEESPKDSGRQAAPRAAQPAPEANMAPQMKQWARQNSWFLDGSSRKTRMMTEYAFEVHQKLYDEGITAEDEPDKYFSGIDKAMREEYPDDPLLGPAKPKKNGQKRSNLSGRNRSTSASTTGVEGFKRKGNKIVATLSPEQKAIAAELGISHAGYAKQLYKLQQQQRGD